MESSEAKAQKKKRPYAKPRLRKIELVAEEVLGIGCKTGTDGAPMGFTCVASGCSLDGT